MYADAHARLTPDEQAALERCLCSRHGGLDGQGLRASLGRDLAFRDVQDFADFLVAIARAYRPRGSPKLAWDKVKRSGAHALKGRPAKLPAGVVLLRVANLASLKMEFIKVLNDLDRSGIFGDPKACWRRMTNLFKSRGASQDPRHLPPLAQLPIASGAKGNYRVRYPCFATFNEVDPTSARPPSLPLGDLLDELGLSRDWTSYRRGQELVLLAFCPPAGASFVPTTADADFVKEFLPALGPADPYGRTRHLGTDTPCRPEVKVAQPFPVSWACVPVRLGAVP